MSIHGAVSGHDRVQLIVGRSLTVVTFVHDYIQLTFDGPGFTIYTMPQFRQSDRELRSGQSGYCDAMCSQIGVAVTRVELTDVELVICLDGGAEFAVSLRPGDYVGPEAFMFTSEEGILVV